MKNSSFVKRYAFISRYKEKSTNISNELIDDKEVSPVARFLYVLVTRVAPAGISWQSGEKFASILGVSEQYISDLFGELREKGWVTRIRKGAMKTNITILHAYKGEKIPEKELEEYEVLVEKEIELWKWNQKLKGQEKEEENE